MRLRLAIVLLCSATLVHCLSRNYTPNREPGPAEVVLRIELEPGAMYRFQEVTEEFVSQQVPGRTIRTQSYVQMDYDWTVRRVHRNGELDITMSIQRIMYRKHDSQGFMSYDSLGDGNSDSLDLHGQTMAAYAGKSIELHVSPLGEILSVANFDSVQRDIPDETRVHRTETEFRNVLESTFRVYPRPPVGAGDRWESRFQTRSLVPTEENRVWSVESMRRRAVALSETGQISTDRVRFEAGGHTLSMSLLGEQSGEAEIDRLDGIIRHMKIEQQATGQVHVISGSRLSPGTRWPIIVRAKYQLLAHRL